MPAYVIFIREKTRNRTELDAYQPLAGETIKAHGAKVLAIHTATEVVEGPLPEDLALLEFESFEAAKAWYHSAEYQAASVHRFQGADYRAIIVDGLPPKA